jgi:nucleoside-diphosphate-sugar epimerase
MPNILIAGCGYIGTALGEALAALGHSVFGLNRHSSSLPANIQSVSADLSRPDTLQALPGPLDYVFYTAGADGFSEESYRAVYVDGIRNLLRSFGVHPPKRILFTSSIGVYGQNEGEVIDEDSPVHSTRFQGQCLLEGEQLIHEAPCSSVVLRLGGIYGPGRHHLLDAVKAGSASCRPHDATCLNLIHRDDAVAALMHLMDLEEPDPLYLVVDDEPVERNALLQWLAEQLAVAKPPFVPPEPGAAQPRGKNRRCSNQRLRQSGFSFRYPSYRQGYAALIEQQNGSND